MDPSLIDDLRRKNSKQFAKKYKHIMEKTPIDEFTIKIIDAIDGYVNTTDVYIDGESDDVRQTIDDILHKLFDIVTRYRGVFPPPQQPSVTVDREFIKSHYCRRSMELLEKSKQSLIESLKQCATQYPETRESIEQALKMKALL